MKNILVFAAHPDDELLGVVGTVRRLANEGKTVRAVILAEGLTSRDDCRDDTKKEELIRIQDDARATAKIVGHLSIEFCGYPDNRMDSLDLLTIIKTVSIFIKKYSPDTIFTNHHGDLNIDNRKACEAVLTACRPVGKQGVRSIYAFETLSSIEWNYNYSEPFKPNVYVDVTDTIKAKILGISCYRAECAEYPHPRSVEGVMSLGKNCGSNAGFHMAEAFMFLRQFSGLPWKHKIFPSGSIGCAA